MGLGERYVRAPMAFLGAGVAVSVASLLSQYAQQASLPLYVHGLIWAGALLVCGGLTSVFLFGRNGSRLGDVRRLVVGGSKPNVLFALLVVALAASAIQLASFPVLSELSSVEQTADTLSTVLVMIGVGHLVVANTLKAHFIRLRDRGVFYVGGLLTIVLGVLTPHVGVLRTWGYAVMGVSYLLFTVLAFLVFSRGETHA